MRKSADECVFMKILLLILSFAYPSQSQETGLIFNKRLAVQCLKPVCYPKLGCIEPWILTSYLFSFPALSICPEDPANFDLKYFVLSKEQPTLVQTDLSVIPCGSRVAFFVHGATESADDKISLLPSLLLLQYYDFVILLDWRNPASPPVILGFPIPGITYYLISADSGIVGRYLAVTIAEKLVRDTHKPCINPKDIRIVGFSAGANMLWWTGDWLQSQYKIKVAAITGLEPAGIPYYFTNFKSKQLNADLADEVDVFQCTFNPPIIGYAEIRRPSYRVGSYQTKGSSKFLVNYPESFQDQPGCNNILACSHIYCVILYAASLIPGCTFQCAPCTYSVLPVYGSERTELATNGKPKGMMCVKASAHPFQKCKPLRVNNNVTLN